MNRNNYKKHNKTASIEFEGSQEDSVIYYGGRYGTKYKTRKRKLIEDILIIGSILTGWNWGLTSRRKYNYYPLLPISNLSQLHISETSEVESHFKSALKRLLDKNWQIQYENGFHLRMLFNQANINHMESRFLSNMIIWEWLYPHEKNPNGATPKDESQDLKEIINYILTKHWPAQYKMQNKNIFHALRNQLAHSGTLPINRSYAENWMKQIPWEDTNGEDLQSYLKFFNILTQVVVLKTIDINADYLIQPQLDNYLSKGSLD
ncbi:TPA: hypothetical protein ACPSKY_002886 [Legionella bozemanae]